MKKTLLILAAAACVGIAPAFGAACSTNPALLGTSPGNPPGNNMLGSTSNATSVATSGLVNGNANGDTYGPCTVNTATFNNISYLLNSGSFTTAFPYVAMAATNSIGSDTQIEFNPNLAAGSDLQLEFLVIDPGINAVDLSFNGTGNGFVNEVVCTSFMTTGQCGTNGNTGTLLATLNVTNTNQSSVGTFAGQNAVWIFKDINSGNSPFSEVTQDFFTPEPASLTLLGAGLLGLGLMRRRMKK